MSFASRSRELLWRLGVRPAMAHASRAVRATLEAPELLLRILEFLPIDDVCGPGALLVGRYGGRWYHGNRCLKAVSREFCYAARHSLTRSGPDERGGIGMWSAPLEEAWSEVGWEDQ